MRTLVVALAIAASAVVLPALPVGAKPDPLAAPSPAPTGLTGAAISQDPTIDIDTLTTAKETYMNFADGTVNRKRYAPSEEAALTPAFESQTRQLLQAAGAPTAFILVERDPGTPLDTYVFRVETSGAAVYYRFAMDEKSRVTSVGFAPAPAPSPTATPAP
jgi:hypothetical protein